MIASGTLAGRASDVRRVAAGGGASVCLDGPVGPSPDGRAGVTVPSRCVWHDVRRFRRGGRDDADAHRWETDVTGAGEEERRRGAGPDGDSDALSAAEARAAIEARAEAIGETPQPLASRDPFPGPEPAVVTRPIAVETARRRPRPWVPVVVALVVLGVVGAAGYGLAYLTAGIAAAPTPYPTVLPTPTLVAASPSPTPEPTPTASGSATATPSATPTESPGATPLVHVVQSGEFLDLIARRFGVSLQALIEANDIENPDQIEVGDRLIIPLPSPTP